MRLAEIATYVNEKISSSNITLDQYVTTDSLLQDKRGREYAQNLPPVTTKLIHYQTGDVLVANIRPYLKKVWFADCEGGASSDVLVLRAQNANDTTFVYALLMQDSFYDYAMKGAKGSKMPRGDKDQIMRYEFPIFSPEQRKDIGKFITDIESKIAVNRQINDNLEAMAKQLYDYWFIQFDFPNEEGKPYKSSGGKMVWSDELQMNIPHNWVICRLNDYIDKNNTGDWGNDTPSNNSIEVGCIRGADILKLNNLPRRYIKKNNIAKLLSDWDMVIEVSGGSPTQATGRSALITPGTIKRNGGKITCSNFCHAFSFKSYKYSAFFFFAWKMFYVNDIMFNYEGKTSGIKNFMTETFLANKWVMPKQELVDRFFEQIRSIYSQIDANIAENNHLTKQRDELLPLLMNGQVSPLNSD